ncbi:sensor histidine kinase, partial [Phocaeicola coprophilus]
EWAVIRLSDNGAGMSETEKQHLFTLFYRGEKEHTTEGHGIGMALAQKIIHLHDGRINVHSAEGKGTTFIVELPHV